MYREQALNEKWENPELLAHIINTHGPVGPVVHSRNLEFVGPGHIEKCLEKAVTKKGLKPEYHKQAQKMLRTAKKNLKEENMDPITEGIRNIQEGNLEQMRQNFNNALAQKAVEKLEEKKLEIASNYFGIK